MEFTNVPELNDNLNKIYMDISEMKMVRLGREWSAERVCSVFTRIYMVTEGSGRICCRGKEIPLKPWNIYVIPAGTEFSYSCEDYMEKIFFHLSVFLPNHYDIFNRASDCFVFEDQQEVIEDLKKRLLENKLGSVITIKSCLYDIVQKCIQTDYKMNEDIVSYSEVIEKTLEYIEGNLSAALTVSQVAEAMFLSPSKLQKVFKKEMGLSVGRFIDKRLMYAAEREVRRGEYSMNEISAMLGFCDQFYFSRRFSETYGIPPLQYRKTFAP